MPSDEEIPLSPGDLRSILDAVGERAVLVGGQAVAWWADHYARLARLESVKQATDLYVSTDADFVASSVRREDVDELVAEVARRLRGIGNRKFSFDSLLVGSVIYQDAAGRERRVEFLKGLYGIKRRESLLGTAISFEAQGGPTVYVLAPAFLAESRIANLVGLPRYQNTRGLLQARVALEVLREWNRDELDIGWEHARESMERTIRLAVSRRGIRAASLFGVDVLGAIPYEHPALPPAFVEQRYRRAQQTLRRATEAAHALCRSDKDE